MQDALGRENDLPLLETNARRFINTIYPVPRGCTLEQSSSVRQVSICFFFNLEASVQLKARRTSFRSPNLRRGYGVLQLITGNPASRRSSIA